MIRKVMLIVILFGGGLALGSIITSGADGLIDSNSPGTANDPLVTKSYVDKQIQALKNQDTGGGSSGGGSVVKVKEKELTVVELKGGHALYAKKGSEFIVRSNGKTTAFSPNANGIPDLTGGKDLPNGTEIPINHLLLFPLDDGRGIKVDASETRTIYVMVVGDYKHVDANGNEIK